jgi:hypothetical protein
MDSSAPPLHAPLPFPARGGSSRVQMGGCEVVLEAVRGGFSFLWTNGRSAIRHVLGLTAAGQLSMQLRAPKFAVRIVPREAVTVVPGGRVAGYLQVGLVPTLVWHDARGSQVLLEIAPEDQAAEWDEQNGHLLHSSSPWFVRFPMRNGEARAVVPVRVCNRTAMVQVPPYFDVLLQDAELVAARGSILAAPRRLSCRGQHQETIVRTRARAGVGA